MGLGPDTLSLYRQLKAVGAFDGITDVVELGSQGVWCSDRKLIDALCADFGKPPMPEDQIAPYLQSSGTGHASARNLHTYLGHNYVCVDIDKNFGAITLDLNFDSVPPEWRARFDFVTNHGTTEHLLNQLNAFKVMHDLTKVGGLMLHAVPFTHLNHGFFNYQPTFFEALARFNAYGVEGFWVRPDWQLSSMVPWQPRLMELLKIDHTSTHMLVVLLRKRHAAEFQVPIQDVYELMLPPETVARYNFVIDGEVLSGKRVLYPTMRDITLPPATIAAQKTPLTDYPARELASHLAFRIRRRIGL